MILQFILFFFIIVIFQPFFDFFFFFLIPILEYFFQKKNKKLVFNLIFLSLLTDFIFIKPFGFFLVATSFSLILISLLEKILPFYYFYHKLIYLLTFNISFLFAIFYFLNSNSFLLIIFLKILFINFIFQSFYFLFKENIKLK